MEYKSQFYYEFLSALPSFSEKMNQDGIFALLNELGNFHDSLNVIHVAGTNGKGSTVAMLSSIYHKAGYTVGSFVSPYFSDIRECIYLNTHMVSIPEMNLAAKQVSDAYDRLRLKSDFLPTHYECITVVALLIMKRNNVDLCFVEALMGGKNDATNIFNAPLLTIITSISYDHTEFLGSTLTSIAEHKAGIIKKNTPLILNKNSKEVIETIAHIANQHNAPLLLSWNTQTELTQHFFTSLSLRGKHQYENLLGVLAAINTLSKCYNVTQSNIIDGLSCVIHPCRLEQLSINGKLFLLDGSHNLQGIEALSEYINTYLTDYNLIFIFGILRDKDIDSILPIIASLSDKLILVTPQSPRALASTEVFDKLDAQSSKKAVISTTIEEALNTAADIVFTEKESQNCNKKQATCIVACGSFTVSFPVRNLLI